ncbi:RNB domain-containing ribonuclease, partial [uncultured Slackia sp.]|uniref:RNB domain-containing ribonuclease n=1 Tax=uncultured Slackia sp. TaxID=665903 RepID=UPI0025D54032
ERRAMSVDLFLDAQGCVRRMEASPSIIRSCARLAYGWVQHGLEAQRDGEREAALACISEAAGAKSEAVLDRLMYLDGIARKLHASRIARGGMDFESEEAKVRLDAQGRPVSVDVRVKTDATSLVEEAMIAANEAVACFLRDAKVALIYRVHDAPAPADLVDLKPILQEFGYDRQVSLTRFCSGDPFAIQEVLAAAQGRREEYLVSSLIVRAMKRAVYRDACGTHFGLASEAYTHFTSPIRRYPDLMVHRMLKCALFGRSEETSAVEAAMSQIAQHSSEAERTAEAAARESQELKLYELLEQRVGEEADGIVSGVVSSGFFVRLADTTEGFVALRGAGEYWMLDAQRRTLTGSDSGSVVRLGMRVRIRIKDVRPLERRADFVLVSKGRGIGLRLRG